MDGELKPVIVTETDQPATPAETGERNVEPALASGALDSRGIAGAALLVMIFFVLSRITGLAREIIIGAQFGTSAQLDVYLAAFRLPDLLFQLVAGGALGSAFIPTFSAFWVRDQRDAAWLLFSRVLNGVTLLLVVVALIAGWLADPIVRTIIAPGFSPEQQTLTADLMRWMLISTVVFGASGLIMGALNAVQHFLLPAAAPVLYNLAIIGGAWLLAPRFGVYGLVIGVVSGAVAHLLVQIPGLWRRHAHYSLSLSWRDAGVREVARLMGPRVLGLFFVQMHFLVNTILASNLAAGSLSALNYAWLIMLLPQGVFAQAVATAAFPTFAAQVGGGQRAAMRTTFGGILRMVLFLTIPAALVLAVMGEPLVTVLLQRGEFTAESTRMVVFALRFYALGLVAHSAVEIIVRAFYALHDTATPVMVGIAAMVLNILLSVWWVRWLSYGGLALANSSATLLEMVVLLLLLSRRMQGIDSRRLVLSAVRSAGAALVMAAALLGWLNFSAGNHIWLVAAGGLVLAAVSYLAASALFNRDELKPALLLIRRRR